MRQNLTSNEHAKYLHGHYLPLLKQHGTTFRSVDWGSQQSQILRFKVLLEVGEVLNASILDVGCGVGHLINYLTSRNFNGNYLGIDILPEMIACAQKNHLGYRFQTGDILHLNRSYTADYVLGSGLFTFSNRELMEMTILSMFDACKKAVAFNSLSAWANRKEPGEFYADPLATVQFCRTLTPWVVLRHDYMPHDFTIYMYKEQQGG